MGNLRHIFNVFFFIFTAFGAFAQTEDEMKESAAKLFENEQYVEATSQYLRLISLNPKNADYNFRYGTCLLFNSFQKTEAIRYLSYAIAEQGIDPRAFYFYGRSLHLNYQFDDAIKIYKKFLELRERKDKRYNVEREIEMCENGKKLLVTFTDIIVSEKQEIDEGKFFRLYKNMETIGGDILVSAEFQSKIDKKYGHVPIVHFPPQAKAIYYSSYGESEDNGLDIYIRRRLPDGGWGDPQILPGQVNSKDDEDFPYMHPSGDFLYFSSKGHNSMGGYDVFFSRYNPDINAFGKPENVDFAISSPDDDFFYVVDSTFKSAYFASARQSQNGKLHVYNVRVARVPIQEVIVMGNFLSEINPNNETMRITVTSNSNGAEIGKIVSNEKGKYSFVFPKGGKYNYEITVDGNENNTYKYIVELPFLDEFKPLKQKAIHKMVDGEEIVTIINLFDEDVEGAEAIIADVIRKKASLEVNVNDFDLKELERIEQRNKILAEIGFNNMSIPEVSERLGDLASGEEKRSEMVERITSNLDLAIIAKSTELSALNTELKQILAKVEQTSDAVEKHPLLMQAKKVESEINQLTAEIAIINTMKNEVVQKVGAPSTNGIGKIEVIENQFNALVSSGKEEDAIALLIKNKDVIQKAKDESAEKYVANLVEKSVQLNEVIKGLKKQQVDFEVNQSALEAQINLLSSQLLDAKKKDAELITSQIKNKETELVMVKEVLTDTKKRIIEKNTELDVLNNSIETLQKAMSNTDLAAYNKSEVETAIKKVINIENEVISKGIDSQINEIERENPELNPAYQPVDFGDNSLAEIQKEYTTKIEEITSNSNLSEEEKLNLEQKANNESTANINRRINAIERELAVTPNNETLIEEQNSLNAYKNELEQENTRLNEKLTALNSISTNKTNQLDEIKTSLATKISDINKNNTLSPKEKIEAKEKVFNESIASLNEQLTNLKKELQANPNNTSLRNEQSSLTTYKSELEANQLELSNELLVLNSTNSTADLLAIQNSLNKKIESIQTNNSLSPENKLKEQQKVNNESLVEIFERLNELEQQLENNPQNENLKNEKIALNEYKTEIEVENKRLATELSVLVSNGNTPQTNQLASIQSQLNEKIEAIKSDNSTTDVQKLKAQQQANNESIAQVDKRLNEIEKALSNDPNNVALKNEQAQLVNFKSELQSENLSLNSEIITLSNGNAPQTNQLASIQSQLNEKIEAIKSDNSTTDVQKLKAQQQANNESIAQVDKRINELEKALSNDPNNVALKNEQAQLVNFKSELQSENLSLNSEIIALSNGNTPQTNQLTSMQSQLNEKIEAIKSDNSTTDVQKLKAQQQANNESIAQVDKRINELEAELSNDPENTEILEDQLALIQYKTTLEQQNDSLAEELTKLNSANTNATILAKKEILSSVQADYEDNVAAIKANNTLSEVEQLNQLQTLDQQLIAALEKEIATNEKALKKQPEDKVLINKKEILNELISEKQDEIEERTQLINAKTNVSSVVDVEAVKTELLTTINPNYQSEKETINSSNSTEFKKIEALLQLEVEQLTKLESKKAELEKELKRSPSDQKVKTENQVINSLIEAQKNEIEALKTKVNNSITADIIETKVNEIDDSYYRNIAKLQNENSSTQGEQLKTIEVELQEKITAAIAEKEKALNRSYSVTVELEKAILEKALTESKERELNPQNSITPSSEKASFIAEIRSSNEQEIANALNANPTTKTELESADIILSVYENQLIERIETIKNELQSSPSNELQNQQEWLENELKEVQQKRRQFSVTLGELETEIVSSTNSNEKLNALEQKEQSILAQLNDTNVSTAEKKELESQLNNISTEKVVLENEVAQQTIIENKKENENLSSALNNLENDSSPTVEKAKEFNTNETKAIEELTLQAEKAKTEQEKQYILNEAVDRQEKANNIVKDVVNTEKQLALEEKENVRISSLEELENQKRKFTVQIGELTTQIVAVEKQIDKAKKSEIPALEIKKQQLVDQKSLLETQLREIEERIIQEDALISVASSNALNENITFNEERKLAGSEIYKEYYELASKALDTEREISLLEQELMKQQKTVRNLLETQIANENEAEIQLGVAKIKSTQEQIDRLKIEHVQQKYAAEQKLPSNPEEAIQMQNLVLRDIQPIEASSVAVSLISIPANGFEIKTNAESFYSAVNPIPIDVENPSGLYYRVQIGAFAKPIPQDLFKEFNPVSGEKIEGTNVTRYMAGFFNNSNSVLDARTKIKALGYADAFIVAYCDGKRIGFADARRLEEQGLCVPKGENELVMEVVAKTLEKLGLPTTKEVQEVPELSYNQAPGAVKAAPIELKKGLFFTTQVGVFNRPIAAETVFGMEELITLRLPNGQIRYSSGTFNSIEDAQPRRVEALNKGVVGAFITAYYKGERISLTEAKRLLEENGNSILQSEIEKTEKVEEIIMPKNVIRTDSVSVEKSTTSAVKIKSNVQIVSINQYESFPAEVLSRYNSEGSFYYDSNDKRIKSIVYSSEEELPRLLNYKNDVQTIIVSYDESKAVDEKIISVKINATVVPGDFMNWLMKQPYQRSFTQFDDSIEIQLKGIEPTEIEKVQEDIRTFVLEMEVRNVSDVEFERLK